MELYGLMLAAIESMPEHIANKRMAIINSRSSMSVMLVPVLAAVIDGVGGKKVHALPVGRWRARPSERRPAARQALS